MRLSTLIIESKFSLTKYGISAPVDCEIDGKYHIGHIINNYDGTYKFIGLVDNKQKEKTFTFGSSIKSSDIDMKNGLVTI